jgi:hypothetical protein
VIKSQRIVTRSDSAGIEARTLKKRDEDTQRQKQKLHCQNESISTNVSSNPPQTFLPDFIHFIIASQRLRAPKLTLHRSKLLPRRVEPLAGEIHHQQHLHAMRCVRRCIHCGLDGFDVRLGGVMFEALTDLIQHIKFNPSPVR